MSNCDVRKSKNKIFSDRLKRQIKLDNQDNRFRTAISYQLLAFEIFFMNFDSLRALVISNQ
jgi:hypothetical protein